MEPRYMRLLRRRREGNCGYAPLTRGVSFLRKASRVFAGSSSSRRRGAAAPLLLSFAAPLRAASIACGFSSCCRGSKC